jgi:hypothetical protein
MWYLYLEESGYLGFDFVNKSVLRFLASFMMLAFLSPMIYLRVIFP